MALSVKPVQIEDENFMGESSLGYLPDISKYVHKPNIKSKVAYPRSISARYALQIQE